MKTVGTVPSEDAATICRLSKEYLESLANSQILVSGATGFVGSWLVSTLLMAPTSLNIRVIANARNTEKAISKFNSFDRGNLEIKGLNRKANYPKITHFIHGATPSTPNTGGDNPAYVLEVCKSETDRLLDLARTFDRPVFMHLSSGAVYGPKYNERGNFREESKKVEIPINDYTKAKIFAEAAVEKADEDFLIHGCNPRLFSFAGPGIATDAHFAVGNFMQQGQSGGPIKINGNPGTVRSYLHPIDMTTWLLASLANPSLEPTHIGSNLGYTMSEIASIVASEFNVKAEISGNTDIPANYYVPETTHTEKRLGVSQTIDLPEAIARWRKWLES